MVGAKVVVVVKDSFTCDLLLTEDAEVLVRGAARPFASPIARPQADHMALPLNEWACVHVEVSYEQKADALKGVTVPVYTRCTNTIDEDGAYLCPYHDRVLMSRKLSIDQLKEINFDLRDRMVEGCSQRDWDIVEGIVLQDRRDIKAYPIRRLNGLRVSDCPTPTVSKPVHIDPTWEIRGLEEFGDVN